MATEAARELLRFGFDDLGMHRIFGDCVAENFASARVMEKIGMQREAQLREKAWFKGRWWGLAHLRSSGGRMACGARAPP